MFALVELFAKDPELAGHRFVLDDPRLFDAFVDACRVDATPR